MKIKFFITFFSFLSLIIQAQNVNDPETFIKKMNTYKQSKGQKNLKEYRNVNEAINEILSNTQITNQNQTNYDTIRSILRKHNIYDYQIEVLYNTIPQNGLNSQLRNILNDSNINVVGSKIIENKSLTVLIRNYIEFQSFSMDSLSNIGIDYFTHAQRAVYHGYHVKFKTSLPIVKYILLDSLSDLQSAKVYNSIVPQKRIFQIKDISYKFHYLVIFNNNNEIIYIYEPLQLL